MQITLLEALALIGVLGGGISWLIRLEGKLARKIERTDLEEVTVDRHDQNKRRLERIEEKLNLIAKDIEEHAVKASKYRHESRDERAPMRLGIELLLQHAGIKRGRRPSDRWPEDDDDRG